MIIDAFTFFNELDLLEIRLNTLDPVVDFFLLVEANKTQTLQDKPFYYEENKARFEKFKHKIIHVKLTKCPTNEGNLWTMENYQRNAIKKGLELADQTWMKESNPRLQPTDVVMISDLDEIPNPDLVLQAAKMDGAHCLAFGMTFQAYYANLVSPKKGWVGTVMTKVETLDVIEPQDLRNIKDSAQRIDDAGWHLSWLGGWEKAYTKLLSCIEPLDKSEVPSKEEFQKTFEGRVRDGGFFHLTTANDSVPLQISDDPKYLPPYLAANRDKYPQFFL